MTQTDWNRFVPGTVNAIGRSPTRQLDIMSQTAGTPASYVAALGEFQTRGANIEHTMRDPYFLRHVSCSFLIGLERDTLLQVVTQGFDFAIIMTTPGRMKENFIMTASLDIWQSAVLRACREDGPTELREFYNQIWIFLHKIGFRDVFSQYRRKDLHDKTFWLEPKR